jgi:hypothetical protein
LECPGLTFLIVEVSRVDVYAHPGLTFMLIQGWRLCSFNTYLITNRQVYWVFSKYYNL